MIPAAARHAAAIAELQGVLGDHQDAVVAQGWLRAAVTSGASGPEASRRACSCGPSRTWPSGTAGAWRAAWDVASCKKLTAWLTP